MTIAAEARRLLRKRRFGMLATLSKKFGGHPFGSITPYVLDHDARPVILISTLAEHTKNIDNDNRVSLLVNEPGTNVQAEARLTVLGNCARMQDQEQVKTRYLRYFPNAFGYFDTHDFFFYRIQPMVIRYIGGFGEIHWIPEKDFACPENKLAAQEQSILAHMNQDHAQNLRDYCRRYQDRNVKNAEMIGIDCDGFDVRADGELLRFDFETRVLDALQARAALVKMAKECKA
jgi:heme oxygenase (biliverdin-IX-beta and delta-forming)